MIYYIEDGNAYVLPLSELFDGKNRCRFAASVITLSEVLVMPLREGKTELAAQYENILTHTSNIDFYEINVAIAKESARLRAKYTLKTPDAIQLATARYSCADYFLTNDYKLKVVKDMRIVTLDEL